MTAYVKGGAKVNYQSYSTTYSGYAWSFKYPHTLSGYADTTTYTTRAAALKACASNTKCLGVTKEKSKTFRLNSSSTVSYSKGWYYIALFVTSKHGIISRTTTCNVYIIFTIVCYSILILYFIQTDQSGLRAELSQKHPVTTGPRNLESLSLAISTAPTTKPLLLHWKLALVPLAVRELQRKVLQSTVSTLLLQPKPTVPALPTPREAVSWSQTTSTGPRCRTTSSRPTWAQRNTQL